MLRFLLLFVALACPRAFADSDAEYFDGLEFLRDGRFDDALGKFSAAIEGDSENPRYRIARGATLLFAERPDDAVTDLDRAMALSDRSKESRMWRAAADRMCARFFTEVYPQATRDPFESKVGEVSAMWGQTFRNVEPGYEPSAERQAEMRAQLADLRRWFVDRSTEGQDAAKVAWMRGKAKADAGDWSAAAVDIARAFAAWPEDPIVLTYQAGCRLAIGDPLLARTLYTRALTDRTDLVDAYRGRALAAAFLGDATRARADLARVASRDASAAQALSKQIDRALSEVAKTSDAGLRSLLPALATRRRYDETYQDGLREREEAIAMSPSDPDKLAELADFLYGHADVPRERVEPRGEPRLLRFQTPARQEQELLRATSLCDQALAKDPKHVRALAVKAAVCVWNLQYADAETLLKRALQTGSDDPRVLALLSRVLEVAAAQKRAFAASLRSNTFLSSSTHTEGDYEVTTTWWRTPSQGELAEANRLDAEAGNCIQLAAEHLERAAAARPGTAVGAYFTGVLKNKSGDLEAARIAFSEATRLDPEWPDAWFQLADACGRLGRDADWLAARGEGLNRIETTAAPWLELAWKEILRTKYRSAGALLAEAAKRDPADARVPAYRAIAAAADGKPTDAITDLRSAVALEDARALLSGSSWRAGEKRPLATERLGLGVALRDRLAAILLAQGDARGALDLQREIVDLEPRLARGQDAEELPAALLPIAGADPTIVPQAEPVLVHVAWARVHAAEAAISLGEFATAKTLLEPVFAYGPSRINGWQSDRFRGPELWSHLHLGRIELAKGDLDAAKQHAQMLPRKRHGVGPSKGAFPELEELGSQFADEVARIEQQRREQGDERSDAWHPPDPAKVADASAAVKRDSGLTDLVKYDDRAQRLALPFIALLDQTVQAIVSPKSNRWREDVRYPLQQLSEEQQRLQSQAEREEQNDPRFRREDPALYRSLAVAAAKAIALTRDLAVAQGYPKDALDTDLGSKSNPPGPAPFTGAETDPDAHYAKLCKEVGLPYFRPTDRVGASDENLLSLALRQAVATLDGPKTEEWRRMVVQEFAQFERQRVQAETQKRTIDRQLDEYVARQRTSPKSASSLEKRITTLREQQRARQKSLDSIGKVVAALRTAAIAAGYPAADLDSELKRLARDGN